MTTRWDLLGERERDHLENLRFDAPCVDCGEYLATEADFAKHFWIASRSYPNLGDCPHKIKREEPAGGSDARETMFTAVARRLERRSIRNRVEALILSTMEQTQLDDPDATYEDYIANLVYDLARELPDTDPLRLARERLEYANESAQGSMDGQDAGTQVQPRGAPLHSGDNLGQ